MVHSLKFFLSYCRFTVHGFVNKTNKENKEKKWRKKERETVWKKKNKINVKLHRKAAVSKYSIKFVFLKFCKIYRKMSVPGSLAK